MKNINSIRFYKTEISLCFLFLFLIFFIGCSPKIIQHGLVSYVNSNGKETIKVKADDYGKSEKEAVANAEKLAINTLLNVGITGSEVNSPMIGINVDKTSKEEYLKYVENNTKIIYNGGTSSLPLSKMVVVIASFFIDNTFFVSGSTLLFCFI